MNDQTASSFNVELVTQVRLESLLRELTKRTMVVQEDAIQHLLKQGVIPRMARDGCCKPDGGTCCPNARLRFDPGFDPRVNPVVDNPVVKG